MSEDLLALADKLEDALEEWRQSGVEDAIEAVKDAALEVGESHSKSWLGYHSKIYYAGLRPPPPGAQFSQEHGLRELHFNPGTRGDWVQYGRDQVRQEIYRRAGVSDLEQAKEVSEKVREAFGEAKAEFLSVIASALVGHEDAYLEKMRDEIDRSKIPYASDIIDGWRPRGAVITSDMMALNQGQYTPPHLSVLADLMVIRSSFGSCKTLAKLARQAGSHLARMERASKRERREVGTAVFIGHGRSPLWRELKDFIQDRMGLPWDEFNRVPVAGITNVSRLTQMLDEAAIAFLVLTAEDEQADGSVHARMNVIHEAGLFQGRLGFTKAIVLLEEGCAEFSNIQGLGQIRFPEGNIKASFDDVRQVLEREGLA